MRTCNILVGLALCSLALPAQAETVYDVADDFSTSGNPSRAWSYGLFSTSHPFTPMNCGRTWAGRNASYSGMQTWDNSGGSLDAWTYDPAVTYNSTETPIDAFGFTWAPKSVALDCFGGSEAGGYTTVRWTAPAAGTYGITAAFKDIRNTGDGSSQAYVCVNGAFVFTGLANAAGVSWSPSQGIEVAVGDTVDFVTVGATVTMLDATISQVPEPSSILLLVAGILGLSVYAWRKRR